MQSTQTCSVDGCERGVSRPTYGLCEAHYMRMRRYGAPTGKPEPRAETKCSIDGCDRPGEVLKRTLCRTHYNRHLRGIAVHTPIKTPRSARGVCTIDGCDKPDDGPSLMCKMHATRVRRHGDPHAVTHQRDRNLPRGSEHPKWSGNDVTYNGAHIRVKKVRGKASEHHCVDCGKRAAQWSYTRESLVEKQSEFGPYSPDPNDYVARCVPCHKRFDLSRLR